MIAIWCLAVLLLFCFIVLLRKPIAVSLSTSIGVGGWGWPISVRFTLKGSASLAFYKVAATSVSMADLVIILRILATT